jgi:hypothetical protein
MTSQEEGLKEEMRRVGIRKMEENLKNETKIEVIQRRASLYRRQKGE